MKRINLIELFGGIGAPRKALERLGYKVNTLDYVEFDKHACNSYNAIYKEKFETQDVSNYSYKGEAPVDMLFHGSPCQDFSNAGNRTGGEKDSGTQSSLLWETLRIIKEMKVKPKYIIWENVKGVLNKRNKGVFESYLRELNAMGYWNDYQVLNAKDYGIAQNRNRVFVVSFLDFLPNRDFKFPKPIKLTKKLKDYLQVGIMDWREITPSIVKALKDGKVKDITNADYSETILTEQMRWNNAGVIKIPISTYNAENYFRHPDKAIAPTITAQGANSRIKITTDLIKYRILTSLECWRLMGFDDEDYGASSFVSSKTQLYKQAGNSIVVNVLEHLFREVLKDE